MAGTVDLLDRRLQRVATDTIEHIANALAVPERVREQAETEYQRRHTLKGNYRWSPTSLASGYPGLALFYAECHRAGIGDGMDARSARYLRLAVDGTRERPLTSFGLFSGTTGLFTTLQAARMVDRRYESALRRAAQQVAAQLLTVEPDALGDDSGSVHYDAISGISGVLGALLALPEPEIEVVAAIEKLVHVLTGLITIPKPDGLARWFTTATGMAVPERQANYPLGYYDLGMAHGISGPLSALSLAYSRGYRTFDQRAAIEAASRWLVDRALLDPFGPNWPSFVPLNKSGIHQARTLPPARTAWCYGAPGVSRALWLAGVALGDKALCNTAVHAVKAVLGRVRAGADPMSPTLCHGMGGLLLIVREFVIDNGDSDLVQGMRRLVAAVVDRCDERHPFVAQDIRSDGVGVNDSGLLMGAAGVGLSLLSARTPGFQATARALLIA